ncbi:MAG TPA: ABC transporter substrate-binding protein [Steroidobacteraceae bacterium]|nr:ABC transporter substrate-binding protein [Steroidobacteraceae bacterium]
MTPRLGWRAFAFGLTALVVSLGTFCLPNELGARESVSPPVVGVLLVEFSIDSEEVKAFREGLREAGYAEGRDVAIEWRSAHGDYARIPELAADLVQRKVDVIVVDSTPGSQAVKRATSTIPIVIALAGDLVGSGLVTTLARPGENVTGFTTMAAEQSAKRLQLLKETIPPITRVAVMWNPAIPWHSKALRDLRAAAPSLSIKLSTVSVRTFEQFGSAVSAARHAHAQALYVLADAQFATHRGTLIALASDARLPVIYSERHFAEAGGLMSYGASYVDPWRRSAEYVDKILKGTKPGDLPVRQATKFEFVVNLTTAKALGLTIPQSVLLTADALIR